MGTFTDMVAERLPGPFARALSGAWFGVLCGYTGDIIADALSASLRLAWIKDRGSPDDVLPLIGSERGLPIYPGETATGYRSRVDSAWVSYTFAGAEQTIEAQFALAGYPGVQVTFDAAALGPNGEAAPYWSQFWIYFPYSSGHPVTSDGPKWGSFTYGDGSLYGIGTTAAFYQLIHSIIRKWKPSRWICRGFKFQLASSAIVEISFGI